MICNKLELCITKEISGEHIHGCPNILTRCIKSSDKRSEVKCEEKKKRYIYENTMKNTVVLYRMDDGIVTVDAFVPEKVCKCDYLLAANIEGENMAVLVELKGIDVAKALEQIQGTLKLYEKVFRKFSHVYGRVVVASSVPNLKASPKYVNLAKILQQKYRGNIVISERELREKDIALSDLFA